MSELDNKTREHLFEYLLRMGDDRLVLGHRLSEWCGHAPILEEDIALANISLDLVGQASMFLKLAGETEGKGRSEDDLAFFREAIDFKNVQLVEIPRGDFAFTIGKQFLFDTFASYFLPELTKSTHRVLSGVAEKALKETRYHLRHSTEWVLRLGDGTEESHRRMQKTFEELWMYTKEFFQMDEVDSHLIEKGIVPSLEPLARLWKKHVEAVLLDATLRLPDIKGYMAKETRNGKHSEHLGHLLSQMQIVPRSFPGARW